MTTTFRSGATPARPLPAEPVPVARPTVLASSEPVRLDATAGWGLELALAALTIAGLLGFHRVFRGTGWLGPVIGCGLGVQLVCLLTRRWVRRPLVAAVIDLLSTVALAVWTVVPSTTTLGWPWRDTWRAVEASLSGVGDRMMASTVPVPPTTDFLLLAATGAGIVALTGSWITFRLGRTMTAAFPSLAAFVACSVLGTRRGRAWAIALEIIAISAFVLMARQRTFSSAGWFGSRRAGMSARGLGAALPAVAIAVLAAVLLVPSLDAADGSGLLGWRSAGSSAPRIVISPLVSLSTRLLHESTTDVFTVRSSVPSYWRLTSLDYFDGTEWNARDTYQDVDRKLPGGTRATPGTRLVHEQFHIQSLESVWLPLAFDPQAVTGAGKVSYDARSGSLLTPRPTSDNLDYTVTSLQYLDTLSARNLAAAPAVASSSSLAAYLQLPPSVPLVVRALAQRIVAGDRTEYAKALALQQYFYGPSFSYSLRPPSDGAGTTSLDTFLFQTRTGYCQQFAGSYAVLARAVGLPTRLATGFTTGQSAAGGYQVTDADAHTWPEVWFPRFGWVPFEPTKGPAGAGFAIPGATAYTGDTSTPRVTIAKHPETTPTTSPVTTPDQTSTTRVTPAPGGGQPHERRVESGPKGFGPSPVATGGPRPIHHPHTLAVLGVVLGAVALLPAANRLGRRWRWAARRRRGAPTGGPDPRYGPGTVAVVWEEVAERLAWRGLRRQTGETPRQFADRVASRRRPSGDPALRADLHRLADILAQAEFGPVAVGAESFEEADLSGRRIASVLARGRGRRERFALFFNPRWAWAPRTIVPSKSAWSDVTLS